MLIELKDDLKLLLGYSQLFPLCFAVFVSMLGFGLVMPLLPIYVRNFGATGTQLGFLTASFAISRLLVTFPGGWLADKKGRKKPVILGLLGYSIVMTLYGFSNDVNQLILFRGLQGLASGIVWPIMSTMVVEMVMPKDRAKALGLYEMMWFFGMVVGPGLGGILTTTFTIAVPFFACGALAFISTILVVATVQETADTSKNNIKAQDRLESLKADIKKENGNFFNNLTPYVSIFVGLCIARFILAFSHSLIQPVLSVYANEILGVSEAGIGILFTTRAIITLLFTLPMGTAADKIGRRPMIIIGKILDATAAILIIISGHYWLLLVAMMVRGLGRALSNPSITAIFSSLVPYSQRGRSMGIFSIFQNLGLVVGATMGGFLYEFYSPQTPFIACASIGIVGVLVVLFTVYEPEKELL